MSEHMARGNQLSLSCDRCGLQAVAGAPIDQPIFHVFEDGTLCEDCYRVTRDHRATPSAENDA